MNCKQGDLAIQVRSIAGNEGLVVRCLRLIPAQIFSFPDGKRVLPAWQVDKHSRAWTGVMVNVVADECLRPIRPGDVSDEEVRDLYAPKLPETTST